MRVSSIAVGIGDGHRDLVPVDTVLPCRSLSHGMIRPFSTACTAPPPEAACVHCVETNDRLKYVGVPTEGHERPARRSLGAELTRVPTSAFRHNPVPTAVDGQA